MTQLSFFDIEKPKPKATGADLRDRGIKQAAQHAEHVHPSWHNKALAWLERYARAHQEFSGEEVRMNSLGIVPTPPSLRAWGGILLAASKRGWIRQIGWVKVKNPSAHQANAALWRSCLK